MQKNKNELKNLPLRVHLQELRRRLLVWLAGTLTVFLVLFTWRGEALMQLVTEPVRQLGIEFIYVNLAEALSAQMKVALLAALLLTLPLFLWQAWRFVRAGPVSRRETGCPEIDPGDAGAFCRNRGGFWLRGGLCERQFPFSCTAGRVLPDRMLSISAYVSFLLGFILPFGSGF
jgi:sec-independent protein translocase protein TatC